MFLYLYILVAYWLKSFLIHNTLLLEQRYNSCFKHDIKLALLRRGYICDLCLPFVNETER